MVSLASSLSTAALLHQDPHHHGLVGVCGGVQGCASRHLLSLSRVVDLLLWTCRVGARSPVQQGLHGLQVPHGSGHHECRGPAVPVASAQTPSYRSREMTWAWPMVAAEWRAVVPSDSLVVSGLAPSSSSWRTLSRCPRAAATCRALPPVWTEGTIEKVIRNLQQGVQKTGRHTYT